MITVLYGGREASEGCMRMKAMVVERFGGPEVLAARELERPAPGAGQVLVRVHGSSVNPADAGARAGAFGPLLRPPLVLGFDVAGVVEEIGPGVAEFSPGDEVYYAVPPGYPAGGGYAEYHLAAEPLLARRPRTLSHGEAAVVPVAGGTAYAALIDHAGLRLGHTVLIHGGAGGVGHFAVQIARAAGAFVVATAGPHDLDFVRGLGAHEVVDYKSGSATAWVRSAGLSLDVVLNTVPGLALGESLTLLRPGGHAATVTGIAGDLNVAMRNNGTVHFVHLDDAAPRLRALAALIDRGQVRPHVHATYPLEQLAEAHRALERPGKRGKIAVQVRG